MTITGSEIYWITRFDYIGWCCVGMAVFWGVLTVFCMIGFFAFRADAENEEDWKRSWIWFRWSVAFFAIMLAFICGVVFTPTTKEAAMIKVVPAIVNSDFMQKDVPNEAKQIYTLGKKAILESLGAKNVNMGAGHD